MPAGGQPGNKNAVKNKIWSDAIRKEVLSRKRLDKLAKVLCDKAEAGDMQAMKEIGDRVEGKAVQPIEGTGPDGEIVTKIIAQYVGPDGSAARKT